MEPKSQRPAMNGALQAEFDHSFPVRRVADGKIGALACRSSLGDLFDRIC